MSSCIKEESEVRRGPWTIEEDTLLTHYIATHGVGPWNMLAKSAGLKRTGKSCRLRWLNYLKPDIKRGNLTLQEQHLIIELHSKWGNRWSKIAEHLPGRTDNEIKNYWRTRVQKQACSMSSQVSVPCQLPECIVPSLATFSSSVTTDSINISEQTEFPLHKTSPNVYGQTCVNSKDQVLNGSCINISSSGHDMASMSAVGEGSWLCNEMSDTLWQWD